MHLPSPNRLSFSRKYWSTLETEHTDTLVHEPHTTLVSLAFGGPCRYHPLLQLGFFGEDGVGCRVSALLGSRNGGRVTRATARASGTSDEAGATASSRVAMPWLFGHTLFLHRLCGQGLIS